MVNGRQQLSFAIKATNEASATLKTVQGDIDRIGGTAEQSSKRLGGMGSSLGSVSKIAGGFVVGSALTSLPGLLTGAAEGALADEAATIRLDKALENYTATAGLGADVTARLKADMDKRIIAGQKLAFTDDEIRDSFQDLLAATGDYDEAVRRQAAAMELARGKSISLEAATRPLMKLNEENIEVFRKMGIIIGENATEADALAAVNAKFGGQAEVFAKSNAGQYEVAKIQMSELKEQVGSALIPVMVKLTPVLLKVIEAIGKMSPTVLALVAGVGALLPILVPILALLPAIAAGFTLLLGPVGLVILAIAAVIAAGVLLYKHWDDVKAAGQRLMDWFQSLPGFIKGPMEILAKILLGPFIAVKDAIEAVIALKNKFGGGGDSPAEAARSKYNLDLNSLGGGVGEFASGGIVPGPRGSAQMAIVHGGETILPTHMGAVGNTYVTVNVQGAVLGTSAEVGRFLAQALGDQMVRGKLGLA